MVATRPHEDLDARLADTLLDEARQRNWILINPLLSGGVLPDHQRPAGAIITMLPDDRIAAMLLSMNVPVVRLGRLPHPQDDLVPAVFPDHDAAGRLAAEYFIKRGFRELGCVIHAESDAMGHSLETFSRIGQSHGCRLHTHLLRNRGFDGSRPHSEHFEHRLRDIAAWLKRLPTPIGILTPSDTLAAQTIMVCQQAGLSVPEKVAVMGMGNQEVWCEMAPVPISSIDTGRDEMTRAAVQLLDDMMHSRPARPSRTPIPPRRIITRRSTDILAVNDSTVARAIRYVWDNLDQSVSVDDVARAMAVPRHTLDRLFRKHLGRGVKGELIRIRMERCCELLRTTDLPIMELSEMLGYRTVQYLHNTFKKTFGISPRQYRLRSGHADSSAFDANPRVGLPG